MRPLVGRRRDGLSAAAIASDLLGTAYAGLDDPSQKVARHMAAGSHISRNIARDFDVNPSAGQRAADAVARFGGSWAFVALFGLSMLTWVVLNSVLFLTRGSTFDPYPFILLNLFLSMLAAIQAPVILMSQNRQSEVDRRSVEHDYEVNLKAELEIMMLHDKLDLLREKQWEELIALQRHQLELLARLTSGLNTVAQPAA